MQQTATEAAAKPTLVAQSQGNDKSPRSRVVQKQWIHQRFIYSTSDWLSSGVFLPMNINLQVRVWKARSNAG